MSRHAAATAPVPAAVPAQLGVSSLPARVAASIVVIVFGGLAVLTLVGMVVGPTGGQPTAPGATPVQVSSSAKTSTAVCWWEPKGDGDGPERVCGDPSRMPVGSVRVAPDLRVA